MSEPTEPTSLSPLPDPDEDAFAGTLAEVLTSEAGRIEPAERLDQIRDAVARPHRRWVPLVAAVAAIAVVGGGTWAALDHDSDRGGRHAATPIATSPAPTPTPSPPVRTASPSYSPKPPADPTFVVPVYFLGRDVTGLFREFLPGMALGATQSDLVAHALTLATDPSSPQRPGDLSPWLPGTSAAIRVTLVKGSEVDVDLPPAEAVANGRTAAQARLAAQQLVWTATASAQDAGLGVRITFGGQPGKLFGSWSTGTVFPRPPMSLAFEDLSAIWVLSPEQGQVVTGHRVTFTGQACTFEGAVGWTLIAGGPQTRGPVLRSGHTTATSGCPQRGTWSVSVSGLAPGVYTFRADEPKENGAPGYAGLDSTTFVVR